MKKIFLLIFIISFHAYSQEEESISPQEVVAYNGGIVEQLAQMTSMGINPYTSVFLTSISSKFGYSNDYVKTHPFYNNWFVVALFGFLFLFTLIIRPSLGLSKSLSVIKMADEHLEDNAVLVINGIIVLLPVFIIDPVNGDRAVIEAGFLSISFKTLFIGFFTTYYLIVVIALRQFIDFLVFLSPIPFLDSVLEIGKMTMTTIMVFISIYSPMTSFIIALFFFLIGILMFGRAKRFGNKVTYIFKYPIFNIFKGRTKMLYNKENKFSVLLLTKEKTQKFKRGKILRLEKQGDEFKLIKKRLLFPNKHEIIDFKDCTLIPTNLDILVTTKEEINFVFNRSYHRYLGDISDVLKSDNIIDNRTKFVKTKGLFARAKNMFGKGDIKKFKAAFN